MKIIETNGLNFFYGKQKVINNLNLNVPKNSIYGFLGPNGSGKSTTIKLLLGLLKSSNENILLFGNRLSENKSEILHKVGNLIESPTVYQHLSALENLCYINYIYKVKRERIEEVLRFVGLWEERNKRVKNFSLGMKQRLGIGMALFHDPELLILDEPVNGLDPKGVYEIRELLLRLQTEGKTIFISSHILSEIEKICSHVGIINVGEILYQGSMKQLLSQTKSHVFLQTNNNTKAINLLEKENFTIAQDADKRLKVKLDNNKTLNQLITALVGNEVELIDIEKGSSSLEDVFIDLTSN